MLKHCLLALTLAGLTYTVTPFASAQDSGGNTQQSAPAGAPEHGRGHFDPAHRTQMLTRKLNLNADQQAKVLDIYKSAQSQMEGLRSDTSVPQADRRAKMQQIRKNTDDQVRGVLNPDQQKNFDQMQSRREQREEQRQP